MPEDTANTLVSRHVLVRGRVQGVSYRANAQAEAAKLGLRGWVRNRLDGSVEAVVSGPEAEVDDFIAWARKGPPAARVEEVEVTPADAVDETPFGVRPTA